MHGNIGEDERFSHRLCFFHRRAPSLEFRRIDHGHTVIHEPHQIAQRHHAQRTKYIEHVQSARHLHQCLKVTRLAMIGCVSRRNHGHRLTALPQQRKRLENHLMILVQPELIGQVKILLRQRVFFLKLGSRRRLRGAGTSATKDSTSASAAQRPAIASRSRFAD